MIRPILFNGDMVIEILGNRKGITRRTVKFIDGKNPNWTGYVKDGLVLYNGKNEPCNKKPPCQLGDILYVRETVWQKTAHTLEVDGETRGYFLPEFRYAATDTKPEVGWNYSWAKRPSIHMPKIAARIFLKVTDVRIERLQDMTLDDFLAEGVVLRPEAFNDPENAYMQAKSLFVDLWDSTINTQQLTLYRWDANPWVWVIAFERCKKPERWCV